MGVDFSNIESNLELIEDESSRLNEERERIESREQALKKAIACLREDVEISSVVSEQQGVVHQEIVKINEQLENYTIRIGALEADLNVLIEDTERSREVIRELRAIGEDVTEGLQILDERKKLIDECVIRLQEVISKLGLNGTRLDLGIQNDFSEIRNAESMPGSLSENEGTLVESHDKLDEIQSIKNDHEKGENKYYRDISPKKDILYSEEADGGIKYVPKPDHPVADVLKKYGVDGVVYKNGRPDFSPFTHIDTPWGKVNCDVLIANLGPNRKNASFYGKKREDAYDIHTGLGNFEQAEYELARKISSNGINVTPQEIHQWIQKSKSFTWHDADAVSGRMQLVPKEIHSFFRHTGAISDAKYADTISQVEYEWMRVTTLDGEEFWV